jgi:hypothetical protein
MKLDDSPRVKTINCPRDLQLQQALIEKEFGGEFEKNPNSALNGLENRQQK